MMLIAHLPAGYISTKYLLKKYADQIQGREKELLTLGMIFSILPDLDLFYFYFVDSSVHHHKCFPHLPSFWLVLCGLLFLLSTVLKTRSLFLITVLLSTNIVIHLSLDLSLIHISEPTRLLRSRMPSSA